MKRYALSPGGLLSLRARMLLRLGLTLLVVAAVGVAIKLLLPVLDWLGLALITVIVLAIVAMNGYRAIQTHEAALRSLVIEVGADYLLRRQEGTPETRIGRDEIASVDESGQRLLVTSADGTRRLAVPRELGAEAFANVRAALAAWRAG